jgi:protein-L-isoaspartate(D-aspartate) O-methyltransferase
VNQSKIQLQQVTDSFKHKGMRKQMVAEIAEKGIENAEVLSALEHIPRHHFLDNAFVEFAYQNNAFPIGAGQTISHPYTVAFQTQLLKVKKGEKILEIGTGSGYQTSVLCFLGAKVFSIERQKTLFDKTKMLLGNMGINPKLFYGDGYKGLPAFAPFDKVIVTAGAPFIPEALKDQLKVGGILVIPVGDGKVQKMYSITKTGETKYTTTEHGDFKFVPLLEEKAQ